MFWGLISVRELHLHQTCLMTIENGTFAHMARIYVANVQSNKLTKITQRMFSDLKSMITLHLHQNKIQVIESGAFN